MGELGFQWGGPLGKVKDFSEIEISPSAFGSADIDVLDPAAFAATVAQHGGEAGLVEGVKRTIMSSLVMVLSSRLSRDSVLGVMRDSAGLIADVESYSNRTFQQSGASLRLMTLQVTLTEADMAALQERAMASAMALRAASAQTEPQAIAPTAPMPQGPFPPGTRVMATWSDGKSYPGEVKSFDGRTYELVWTGTTAIAWVPAASVRAE